MKLVYKKKHTPKNMQHLVNSRYELLTSHKTVVLLLTAHILSLQDVVFRSMLFLIFY